MAITQKQFQKQQDKALPKGWRKDSNAIPLPFIRHYDDFKNSEAREVVDGLAEIIEEVGMEYLLGHLEGICSEQASLFGDGCCEVFPKDEMLASVWAYFAKRFGDLHKFTLRYQPPRKFTAAQRAGALLSADLGPKKK